MLDGARSALVSLLEAARVMVVLPFIERARLLTGPGILLPRLRLRGRRAQTRSVAGRARLRRVIAAVDSLWPGKPNCYRRALVEIVLDGGAAMEPLHLGLRVPGGPRSGHAWLGPSDEGIRYDVQLEM